MAAGSTLVCISVLTSLLVERATKADFAVAIIVDPASRIQDTGWADFTQFGICGVSIFRSF